MHKRVNAAKFRPMLGIHDEESLTCHSCCESGPLFLRSNLEDIPICVPFRRSKRRTQVRRTYCIADKELRATNSKIVSVD